MVIYIEDSWISIMWNISLTMMQCNHSVALKSFFHQVVWNEPVKLALIGAGCSVATEPTADISHFYNITQVLFTVRNTLLDSCWSRAHKNGRLKEERVTL